MHALHLPSIVGPDKFVWRDRLADLTTKTRSSPGSAGVVSRTTSPPTNPAWCCRGSSTCEWWMKAPDRGREPWRCIGWRSFPALITRQRRASPTVARSLSVRPGESVDRADGAIVTGAAERLGGRIARLEDHEDALPWRGARAQAAAASGSSLRHSRLAPSMGAPHRLRSQKPASPVASETPSCLPTPNT